MILGGPTVYAINPARGLGPRIAHFILPIPGKGKSNCSYVWIPVVVLIIGSSFEALFYQQVFDEENSFAFLLVGAIVLAVLLGAQFSIRKEESKV